MEQKYIKLPIDTQYPDIPIRVIISMCKYANGYSYFEKEVFLFNSCKTNKIKIMNELNIGESMLNKYIKKMVEARILIKDKTMRGIYIINPYFLDINKK